MLKANNNTIARNTFFLTLRMVFVMLISLYTSRVILHSLGVEDYGVYNVVCGFVSMFSFLNASMNNGIQRFYNFAYGRDGGEGAKVVYCTSIKIQLILAAITLILVEIIGIWYIKNKMVIPDARLSAAFWVFEFSIISLVLVIIQIPYSAAILANERMDYYAVVGIIDAILKLCIAIALPFCFGDKLVVYGLLMLSISILNWFLYFVYAKRKFKELVFTRTSNKQLLKEMLTFSGWNLFGSFSHMVKEQGVNMLLNLFFGPVVNAARGLAYQVTGALQSFISNITSAARPQLTQSYACGNVSRSIKIVFTVSKLCYFSVLVLSIPVALDIDYILNLWLDGLVPGHTAKFIEIVILTSLIHTLNPPLSFLVHATGKLRKYQVLTSLVAIMIIPVSYIILKTGALPESVFWVLFVFQILGQAVGLLIVRTIVPLSIKNYLLSVVLPLLGVSILSLLLPIIVHNFMQEGFLRLIMTTIISVCITTVLFYYLGLNRGERNIIISIVKSRIKR